VSSSSTTIAPAQTTARTTSMITRLITGGGRHVTP
jgi:hypothetical protein